MSMRMLIDARHPEETRVAVVKGNRIEEFDFESSEHKQLKGNIYLAKVTRVEPSLQAAFIDYGGNRHGFLAFSEIHPDYYQIPKADRDALLKEEAEHAAEEERLYGGDSNGAGEQADESSDDAGEADEDSADEAIETGTESDRSPVDESAADELRKKRQNLRRRYKIQDVIQRRQVLLVQVVKEERGNKGAALTTYLSLAGRYCVLMPNTSHGGGISRKISNGADRKRLKSIMSDLDLPTTMGLIVRTAGLQRTKTEIKRDFDYLARLWDEIREKTLKSTAPALIYRDSDLIKRAIRDLYNRDIDEVVVEGEEGYKAARGFMKLLMPSHVRRVKQHTDSTPLFQRQGVEDQLSGMYQPVVQLKSGGYLVINPTEALVSIDINSGRSTREHNIEQTAFATNLEAAAEIARQLRLRDMAGLVVIDFIDMEQSSHVRKVEKAMKDALKNDRARIQVGRISTFGLMEMSRQRLRTGVLEASTKACPHCEGTGLMRTAASAGLSALRIVEDEAARGRGEQILLRAGRDAAVYVLNKKRSELAEIETRYGVSIEIAIDETLEGAKMSVESSGPKPVPAQPSAPVVESPEEEEEELEAALVGAESEEDEDHRERESGRGGEDNTGQERSSGRRRRRRRGGRGRRRGGGQQQNLEGELPPRVEVDEDQAAQSEQAKAPAADDEPESKPKGRRRRKAAPKAEQADATPAGDSPAEEKPSSEAMAAPEAEAEAEAKPKPKRSRRKKEQPKEEAEQAPVEQAPSSRRLRPRSQSGEPARPRSSRNRPARVRASPRTRTRRSSRQWTKRRVRLPRPTTTATAQNRRARPAAVGGNARSASAAAFSPGSHRRSEGATMKSATSRLTRLLMMALLVALSVARPALAESDPSILRDTETEQLFREMSLPLIKAGGMDPDSVHVVLLQDPTINAFVATGQTVYIQSGLLLICDNVNQLQGVVAHELGHVAAGDAIRSGEGERGALGIQIATMVLGAIAVAAGAGDAGMGVMMAGQRAALGKFLAFTRGQEATADAFAAGDLHRAGVSGKGMLDFFGKLQNQEYRLAFYAKEDDTFDTTHPLTRDRIEALQQKLKQDPAWGKPVDPKLEEQFQRVKAKLAGFIDPKQAVIKYPESDQSIPAHYARAYAYHLGGYPNKAVAESDALLAAEPDDPYFLELKGQILLESGHPAEAIAPLREATRRSGDAPLIASMLGHALIATEKPANYAEAKQVLKTAVNRDNDNPFAWYQLGMIYEHEGDIARAALATAERKNLEGDPKLALVSAESAMKGIPVGSPDYLRAQDIAMVSCTALIEDKKEKKEKFAWCNK